MGGRGQSTRRTVTPAAPAPATPAENNVTELAKNPQDPLTYGDLYSETQNIINPWYGYEEQYRINCQTCVLAAELNARGIYVEATGNANDERGDSKFRLNKESWFNLFPDSVRQEMYDKLINNYYGDIWGGNKVAYTKFQKAILAEMSEGQRGLIRVGNIMHGHVVNFEVKNKKVVVFDPQSGSQMDLKTFLYGGVRDIYRYNGKARAQATRWAIASFARIDNVPIITDSELARQYFEPRIK